MSILPGGRRPVRLPGLAPLSLEQADELDRHSGERHRDQEKREASG